MRTISIHQPVYLPWLGFFKKVESCDVFVFLDDVQYEKNGYQNRNKIRTKEGEMWLTVPVKAKSHTLLKDVKIEKLSKWKIKHLKSIEINYSKTNYFEKYWNDFEKIFQLEYDNLIEINTKIIKFIMKNLDINTKIIFSSDLNISESGSERILKICKELKADTYLSGVGGKDYLKLNEFEDQSINVQFQNFHHPVYTQAYEKFIPNMASIDLLFNEGENSKKILNKAMNF